MLEAQETHRRPCGSGADRSAAAGACCWPIRCSWATRSWATQWRTGSRYGLQANSVMSYRRIDLVLCLCAFSHAGGLRVISDNLPRTRPPEGAAGSSWRRCGMLLSVMSAIVVIAGTLVLRHPGAQRLMHDCSLMLLRPLAAPAAAGRLLPCGRALELGAVDCPSSRGSVGGLCRRSAAPRQLSHPALAACELFRWLDDASSLR